MLLYMSNVKRWIGIANRYARNSALFLAAIQIRCNTFGVKSRDYTTLYYAYKFILNKILNFT